MEIILSYRLHFAMTCEGSRDTEQHDNVAFGVATNRKCRNSKSLVSRDALNAAVERSRTHLLGSSFRRRSSAADPDPSRDGEGRFPSSAATLIDATSGDGGG